MDLDRIDEISTLPRRPIDGHKGTFGTVAIVGGRAGVHHGDSLASTMLGAPALSALGAIRSGCGLVKIAAPAPIIGHVLTLAPFATGFGMEVDHDRAVIASAGAAVLDELVGASDALVIGMGMGEGAEVGQLVHRVLAQDARPVVIDADGLNAMSSMGDFARDVRASLVLTPHPGEARRLMDSLSIPGDPAGDPDARIDACAGLAQRIGCIVVLKGRRTLVSDGLRIWVCGRGHQAMAVGGTGDVLSGVIGSIIAQTRHEDRLDLLSATILAVEAHAIAGEAWAQRHAASGGMIASELADELINSVESLRDRGRT